MIKCIDITKVYGENVVLNGFSADFNDTGFYLLLGESGSGKTTLLNILSGFIPFSGGEIQFDDYYFNEEVDNSLIRNKLDYITQDTFFVDYLSVFDNLKIISKNEDTIDKYLQEFGMLDKKEQFPNTLSGGERQRLSIVRALLCGKKTLLLDEPTAALDEENKIAVFEMLSKISKEVLVICSTHDNQAKQFADTIINFDKKNIPIECVLEKKYTKKTNPTIKTVYSKQRIREIDKYIKPWFHSTKRDKKADVFFSVFLTIAIILCVFADTPTRKLDTAIEKLYKLNILNVSLSDGLVWDDITIKDKSIKDITLDYSNSCPNGSENIDREAMLTIPMQGYETTLNIIPFESRYFKLSDKIKYGTYFTKKNQIILSSEMANAMFPSNPERLIGEHLKKNIYSLGSVDFEIVGIFDNFTNNEKSYLKAMYIDVGIGNYYNEQDYRELFFANSKITEDLENDKTFFMGPSSQRMYNLFFDSFKDMKAFYNKYAEKLNENKNIFVSYNLQSNNLLDIFKLMFAVFLPLSAAIIMFSVMFFVMLKKTEFTYNNQFISVFEYAGYPKKDVIRRFLKLNMFNLLKFFLISIANAFVITAVVNLLNSKLMFVNYQIFSYNPIIICTFLVSLLLFSYIMLYLSLKRVRVSSWYENQISVRDLI